MSSPRQVGASRHSGDRDVAVVIACFSEERWPQLSAAVESVLAQTLPAREVVVVVDHNEALHRRVAAAWPTLRVLDNTFSRGASGARNSAAFQVQAPIIAFLDDDAAAHPRWLERLVGEFDNPSVVGVGGGVDAAWERARPAWFPDEFSWVVGATPPTASNTVAEVRNVWAENMAVRRERFLAVGGFRPGFGKVGSHSSPEDTELCIRMAQGGGRWLLVPNARVAHHVPESRGTFRYFVRRSFYEGEGKAVLSSLSSAGTLSLEKAYLSRILPAAFGRELRVAWQQKRLAPAMRSAAILAGALAAGVGYARGAMAVRVGSADVPRGTPA